MLAERILSFIALVVVLAPLAVFVHQYRCVRRGRRTRRAGLLRFAAFAALPAVLYVGVFLSLVGLEELVGSALIGDGYARTLPLVVVGGLGLALIGSVALALLLLFTRRSPD